MANYINRILFRIRFQVAVVDRELGILGEEREQNSRRLNLKRAQHVTTLQQLGESARARVAVWWLARLPRDREVTGLRPAKFVFLWSLPQKLFDAGTLRSRAG